MINNFRMSVGGDAYMAIWYRTVLLAPTVLPIH